MSSIKKGLALLACVATTWSCLPPQNMQGIAFTNNEKIDFSVIEKTGEVNKNYFKEDTGDVKMIRYQSQFCQDVMVFVGSSGVSYQAGQVINCMGVILDTSKTPLSKVNLTKVLLSELTWLRQNNTIAISKIEVDEISTAFVNAPNGSVQYWTLQKALIGYNMWYEKKADGIWDMNGVKAVRAVNAIAGCSSIKPQFSIPSGILANTTTILNKAQKTSGNMKISTHNVHDVLIMLNHNVNKNVSVKLISPAGKVMSAPAKWISTNECVLSMKSHNAQALYCVVVQNGSNIISKQLLMIK
jgi:hypothetical protein